MIAEQVLEFHEVANLFPLIEGQEFDELVKDIKEHGLKQSIWTHQGKIIDGRNRYRACMVAHVEPHFQEWDEKGSLVAFVVSLNVKRRHLTSSQLSVIALGVEKQLAVEAKGRQKLSASLTNNVLGRVTLETVPQNFGEPSQEAAKQAAHLLNTNHEYVSAAKRIERNAPELIPHIIEGTLTISDAKAIAVLSEERRSNVINKVVQKKEEEGRRISSAVKNAIEEALELDHLTGSVLSHTEDTSPYSLLSLKRYEEEKEKHDVHVMRVMGSSDSPEWYTPQEIIDLVYQMFGTIDTDPCSNSHEKPSVPARVLYTKEDNGLLQTWRGKTYLNPPYGAEISQWTDKLVFDYRQGNIQEALALLPARIDTVWFSPLYDYLMCNVRGRIQYANSPYHAPFPCVIVYLGTRTDDFIRIFKSLGPIMRRIA